ncbi:SCP2 sterol-binding domain-containing protein [Butyrivibrio sp. AE2032]|uniref:SCP2 sterol-binding domain-containing protein n=1 Tax=Butyrivibrio sp. AE2032 TaxID=1458463 RepID=UPI000552823D|nr:SCP2 sterol-binding domain-containing protein [Butyrivibrio sp. AE2032]
MQKKKTEPTFGSIFRAVEEKCGKVSFLQDTATQITLNGNLDNLPLYVKIEDGMPEVAPYEYINAPFYIDADAETFAAILNGDKSFTVAVAQGFITINGDAAQAVVFCSTLFG